MMLPATFQGLKVVVTPDIPKLKLAPGDYITAAYRQEIDLWLLGLLGTTNLIKDGETYMMEAAGTCYMNPRTYARLMAVVERLVS